MNLEQAIQDYIAELKPGRIVTGFQLTIHMVDMNTEHDGHEYWFATAEGQPYHVTRGLIALAEEDLTMSTITMDEDDE